jgi:hypothetical protein
MDSNHRYPVKETPLCGLPPFQSRNSPSATKTDFFATGTNGSNPSPSSGESSTNLLAASRREFSSRALKPPAYWLSVPLPRRSSAHFSLRKHRHQGLAIRARRRVVDLVRRRIWAGYRDWRRWLLVRPRCCRIGPRRCRAAPACRVAERGASDLMQAMDRSFHAS